MGLPHSICCWFDFKSRLEVLCRGGMPYELKKTFKYYLVDEFLGAVSSWTMDKALQAKVLH